MLSEKNNIGAYIGGENIAQEKLFPQQAMFSKEKAEVRFYPVEDLHFARFNANVMEDETYNRVLEDMRAGGPYKIDPLLCWRNGNVIEVLNGNNRLKAAKELRWKQIRAIVDPSITDEHQAWVVAYNKNSERGHIDPWKEAELCASLRKQGLKIREIANKLQISEDVVSRRLSLELVDPKVKEQLLEIPDFGVGHMEVVAQLARAEPQLQTQLMKKLRAEAAGPPYGIGDGEREKNWVKKPKDDVSVDRVAMWANSVIKDHRAAVAFNNAMKMYPQFSKCPKKSCGKPAVRLSSAEKDFWVVCENGHDWSLKTGKLRYSWDEDRSTTRSKTGKKKLPQFVRSTRTEDEWYDLFTEIVKSILPQVSKVGEISLNAESPSGAEISMHLDRRYHIYFRAEWPKGPKNGIHFTIEPKNYKGNAKLAEFHSLIRTGEVDEKKALAVTKEIGELFEKYLPTLH